MTLIYFAMQSYTLFGAWSLGPLYRQSRPAAAFGEGLGTIWTLKRCERRAPFDSFP